MTPGSALQAALAGEHAAVFVLATLGGRVSTSRFPEASAALREAYEAHRDRRDRLREEVAALGVEPAAALPAYAVPVRGRRASALLRAAVDLEVAAAEVYAQLVAASTGGTRDFAAGALVDAAVRAVALGGDPSTYPGLPELERR